MASEKRLIDANDAISKLEDEMFFCKPVSKDDGYIDAYKKRVIPKLLRNVIDWLQNQPTIDAVEVVRCKECHWWRKINAKNGCGICRHEVFSVDDCTVDPVTEPDDFCSYGERKDNESNRINSIHACLGSNNS